MNNPNPSSPAAIGALVIAAISSPIFLGILGAAALWFRQWVDARIGATHTAQAIAITGEAVRAAEQIGWTHGLDPQAKYSEAANRATSFLAQHGIALSDQQLRTLIEGAVTQIKQANGAPMPGVVLTGDSPTVNAAPPVPSGPSPEQIIAAITTAITATYQPVVDAAPVEQPVGAAVVSVGVTPVALTPPAS